MERRERAKQDLYETFTQSALEQEWAKYKYWVMSRSQKAYNDLRVLFKETNAVELDSFYAIIDPLAQTQEDKKAEVNAFEHVWGYFKRDASEEEKDKFRQLLTDYRSDKVKSNEVYQFLFKLTNAYEVSYLKDSYYFDQKSVD